MLNTIYRLVAPRRFEIAFQDISLQGDEVIGQTDTFVDLSCRSALLSGRKTGRGTR